MSTPAPPDVVQQVIDSLRRQAASKGWPAPSQLAEAAAVRERLRAEIERLTQELKAATSAQYISCLFCNERRYRGDAPDAVKQAWEWVKEHAVTCEQHPAVQRMKAAEAREQAALVEGFDAGASYGLTAGGWFTPDVEKAKAAYLAQRRTTKEQS